MSFFLCRRPGTTVLRFAAILGLAFLPHVAPAAELEPDGVLEGFPFTSAASIAISADGRDLYAAGTVSYYREPTPGLVWLRRDLGNGRLEYRRNLFSDPSFPGILGVTMGRDDRTVHVLRRTDLSTYSRQEDGSLSFRSAADLPANLIPASLFLLPSGDQVLVFVRPDDSPNRSQALIFDLDANGRPSLRQTLDATFRSHYLAVLASDELASGRTLLRRVGSDWQTQEIPGFAADSALSAWGTSADRRFLYATATHGTFPHLSDDLVTLEKNGAEWVKASEISINGVFDREITTLALDPSRGDLYVASYDTNGGSSARIDHWRSQEGGRSFAFADQIYDSIWLGYAKVAKNRLVFSADGRHLYTNFAGEPLARLEVDLGDGSLVLAESGVGARSRLERPFKLLPFTSGDTYVMTPAAIVQARFDGQAAEAVSSLDRTSWTAASSSVWVDLALTPGGGAGALTNGIDLVFVDRDRYTGELRIRNETNLRPASPIHSLTISPDGRHLYAPGSGFTRVYYLRRDVPKLVPIQDFPQKGSLLRIAPNGVDAVIVDGSGGFLCLRRDPQSGEIAAAPSPNRAQIEDAIFLADGRLALFALTAEPVQGRLEILRKDASGEWISQMTKNFPSSAGARMVADSDSHYFFQQRDEDIDLLLLAPQLAAFERVTLSLTVVHPRTGIEPQPGPGLALEPGQESLLVTDLPAGNIRRFRRGCGSLYAGACIAGQRFRVEAIWRTEQEQGPAIPLAIGSEDSQLFSFFDDSNWEVLAKVLDGCAINGRFWVFAAASTNLEYDLQVSDTWTGQRRIYHNQAGTPAPAITDGDAFATCDAPSPGWNPPAIGRVPLAEEPGRLHLGQGYEAKVRWTTLAGLQGFGSGLETLPASSSGLFYFFDRNNWEMQVKVLDGCALNGYRWVFGAATTDVGYELEVEELSSGRRVVYTNPVGRPSRAITDIHAFTCD